MSWRKVNFFVFVYVFFIGVVVTDSFVYAQGAIQEYRDVISDSAPGALANHTLSFTIATSLSPGSEFVFTPAPGFSVSSSSRFSTRNVSLRVNGSTRNSSSTLGATTDQVIVTPGTPGQIRYILSGTSTPVTANDAIEFRIGNHTVDSVGPSIATTTTSTTVSTTTVPGDTPGIKNSTATGTHKMGFEVYDGGKVADVDFLIALLESVGVGPIDTRSDIPPERTNGQPTGVVSGVVSGVEVSLETNKFAQCRYATAPGVAFADMTQSTAPEYFWVFHDFTIEGVESGDSFKFYVRCIDLEDNVNEDDYVIEFEIGEEPTGEPNEEGDVEGDGSGTNDTGNSNSDGGSGTGSGGSSGSTSGGGGSGGSGSGGSGSGGGGSGGGFESEDAPYRSGDGRVIINGYAQPGSEVVVLIDGTRVTETTARADASYSVTLDEIGRGVYTFGVYGIDENDVRSSTFSTSFTVSGARTVSLSNINVPPSIAVDPDPVDPGQTLTVAGFTVPDSAVTVENQQVDTPVSLQTFTATSSDDGAWSVDIDTSDFDTGPHEVRARAQSPEIGDTSFSQFAKYGVGEAIQTSSNSDLNQDGSVNLTDFSILLFWWGSDGGDSDPPADINADGTVSLTDFSILLFNWTG
jgi:hypothetical protein